MITAFALLLDRCGLSQREAADFLGVRPDTVKSWASGRNPVKDGILAELRALYRLIEKGADQALDVIARHPGGVVIELGIASDDHEAQSLGWPCVGAHAAMLGQIAARCGRSVHVVPRGSTVATAAAIASHQAD